MADISQVRVNNTDYDFSDDTKVPYDLLQDTVGWTGKNLLENTGVSKTESGVTFTVNSDKSITVNGTATANVFFDLFNLTKDQYYEHFGNNDLILSGCPSGGDPSGHNTNWTKYHLGIIELQNTVDSTLVDGGDSVTIPADWFSNATNNIVLRVRIQSGYTVSNLTFYPMIRKADIMDDTYEPYNPSVKQTLRDSEVIEGKNLILYPYDNTSKTENGITWTDNGDGSINVNGTATADTEFVIHKGATHFNVDAGNYIASSGVTINDIDFYIQGTNDNTYVKTIASNVKNGTSITIDYNGYTDLNIRIKVTSGKTINNVTVYPMLRKATETDSTYEQYYIPLKDSMFKREEQRV